MKVSTDACLFGAWMSQSVQNQGLNLLDIGTGTALLSLMWHQNHPKTKIVALEPNPLAAEEAERNIRSAFPQQPPFCEVMVLSLQEFALSRPCEPFDLIICNPPFFQDHLPSSDIGRNQARHNHLLPDELAGLSAKLAAPNGYLAVLYPANVWPRWLQAAEANGWYLTRELAVKPNPEKAVNRMAGWFGRRSLKTEEVSFESLIIREADGSYSKAFEQLMSPYYIFL